MSNDKHGENALDPRKFAETAVRIDIGESEYSHDLQIRSYKKKNDELGLTLNGTQTYAYNGRPSDADAD